jgi:hypothetical protein
MRKRETDAKILMTKKAAYPLLLPSLVTEVSILVE